MSELEEVLKGEVEIVTPTWSAIVPLLCAALRDGTDKGQAAARSELGRCAQAADRWNRAAAEMIAALEHAERAMAATYDDKAASRTALSEALIVVQAALASVYEGDAK